MNNKVESLKSIPIEEESSLNKYKDFNTSDNKKDLNSGKSYNDDDYGFSNNNYNLGSYTNSRSDIIKQVQREANNNKSKSSIKEEVILSLILDSK
jgi:hypothetical protein